MKQSNLFYTFVLVFILISCSNDNDNPITPDTVQKSAVIENYANIVLASYQDALNDANALETAIITFVTTPTDANFTAAKNAWKQARETYGPTEAYRFYDGPIDNEANGPEALINSWPLDENYIDYVAGASESGIINKPTMYPTIDKATLTGANQAEDQEANVATGYHAIEFLLWGQDLTAASEMKTGQRPYTDFVDDGTASNQNRRREYLKICADLLTDHLSDLVNQWAEGGTYRTSFLASDENTALQNIFTGIATLSGSELSGERIFVPYNNPDTEDEHSCFSDNTDRDIRLNFAGIANVFNGSYGTINGASIKDLITQENNTLSTEISEQLIAAETAVNATGSPFDLAITDADERPKILTAVNALQDLGDKLTEGGAALGLQVSN